jgi:hypothetical protein
MKKLLLILVLLLAFTSIATAEEVLITGPGEAYGHHGNCYGWNTCGDAKTCAEWACSVRGYQTLVSYGQEAPCTSFGNCHLFNAGSKPPVSSIVNGPYIDDQYIDYDWGNWCAVMGVSEIVCSDAVVQEDNGQEVPEFGILAAIGVLGLAGLFIARKRN